MSSSKLWAMIAGIISGIAMAVTILLTVLGLGGCGARSGGALEDREIWEDGKTDPTALEIPREFAEQITSHENGDFVYRFPEEDISVDMEEKTLYVQNFLKVYIEAGLSPSEKNELAKLVDGTIVGDISGCINLLQISVDEEELAGLESLAQTLMESDKVFYASYDAPLWPQENEEDLNPWNLPGFLGTDLGNEDNPGGNDWWAEAVGAYTAWSYGDLFQDVTVGILDNGFTSDHPDLAGNIVFLDGYTENSASDHGTGVAGIIGALNNDVGGRGLASGSQNHVTLLCVDWNPATNNKESSEYTEYISTGEYLEIIKQMVEQGARVINNSWGFGFVPKSDDENWRWSTQEEQEYYLELRRKNTALDCLMMMIQLLSNGEDVLIVQSAGNYTGQAVTNGAFCSITPEVWDIAVNGNDWWGITYDDISQRILIVGAVQKQRDESGNYLLYPTSNYGTNVDLCAPGEDVFTTASAGILGYRNAKETSAAAPIVAGSAAVLWALEPELEASEVYRLLMGTASGFGVAGENQEGAYPMVNVGKAVEHLMELKGLETDCAVEVRDSQTMAPVENAAVTLLDMTGYEVNFENPSEDMAEKFALARQQTDSTGLTVFSQCEEDAYPACVQADGYGTWYGWLEADTYYCADENVQVNQVLLSPGELADPDGLLRKKLEELASQYGVMPVGTQLYSGSGYGGGENVVPAQRLTGYLCGDIWDYDGDGQNELLTVRAQPDAGYALGTGSDGSAVWLTLSVYEAWEDGSVSLAAERSIPLIGLTDTLRYTSLQLTRGSENGQSWLYLDHFLNMNTSSYEDIRIGYNGQLQVAGGVRCCEMDGWAACDSGASDGALDGLNSGGQSSPDDWVLGDQYVWEGIMTEISAEMLEAYRQDWIDALAAIGLTSSHFRTMYEAPEIVVNPEGGADLTAYHNYFYDCCTRRPVSCQAMTGGGTLTELCGLMSVPDNSGSTELTTYDSTGLLNGFRDTQENEAGIGSGDTDGNGAGTDSGTMEETDTAGIQDETETGGGEASGWEASQGFDTPQEAAQAYAEAYIGEDARGIAWLYARETMEYMAALQDKEPDEIREVIYSTYQESFDAGDTGLESYEITECRQVTEEEYRDHFGNYLTMPQEAYRVTISFPPCTDVSGVLFPSGLTYYCFTACFDGLWYLVM